MSEAKCLTVWFTGDKGELQGLQEIIAIYWLAVKWRFVHRGNLEIVYFASDVQ